MKALRRAVERAMAWTVSRRHRLPKWINRIIDDVAKNPDGPAGRLAARMLGGASADVRPTTVPDTPVRVYIGPTNYAGQGWEWARALERSDSALGARNMAIELPGGFAFPADSTVPVAAQTSSTDWQKAEFEAVARFTHVLFEAERSLFGPLFRRDVAREIEELQRLGVDCAFMCHGTDIRSPRLHRQRDPLSPYHDDPQTELLQRDADANLELLRSHHLPIFVSTPDLLVDVPEASWCPVVVDSSRWASARQLLVRERPVVVHMPSMGPVKGTHLIEPAMHALDHAGTVEYRSTTGIPSAQMPTHIGDADIVLDQFRIGSYGVAAVEAMAAGRVVIGHVLPDVRASVRELVGLTLPVVEATPDTLHDTITRLIAEPDRMVRLGEEGRLFVERVHSGALSAQTLRREWIDRPTG